MTEEEDKRIFIQRRLYFYHFLNDGITFVLPTLMASFYFAFNLNWFQAGLVFAFNLLATVIFQIIIGYYTDKNISEQLMKLGLFFLTISSFLMIFSFNFDSLLVFSIISGIALAFQHSIAYATTSRLYHANKDVMIGRQGAAGDIGKCTAVFSSSLIILIFGSWQLVILIWSGIALISFVIITYNFRKIKFNDFYVDINHVNNEKINKLGESPKKFILILILFSYILFCAIYTLLITNLATYLKVEKSGLVSEFSGFILGFTIFIGVIGAYLSGVFKSKFGMTNSIISFSILSIIIISIYVIFDTSDLVINLIFCAVIGFLLFLMYPQLLAAINNCFNVKRIGFGYGLMLSLGWFGNFMGSLIGGYLANLYTANVFFLLSIVNLIIIITLMGITKIFYEI